MITNRSPTRGTSGRVTVLTGDAPSVTFHRQGAAWQTRRAHRAPVRTRSGASPRVLPNRTGKQSRDGRGEDESEMVDAGSAIRVVSGRCTNH